MTDERSDEERSEDLVTYDLAEVADRWRDLEDAHDEYARMAAPRLVVDLLDWADEHYPFGDRDG